MRMQPELGQTHARPGRQVVIASPHRRMIVAAAGAASQSVRFATSAASATNLLFGKRRSRDQGNIQQREMITMYAMLLFVRTKENTSSGYKGVCCFAYRYGL